MESNLYKLNPNMNLNDKPLYLENDSLNDFIPNSCICQCNCECHKKNITFNTTKNKIQPKKLDNNFFNIKLNQQITRKYISKEITDISKNEYTFDPKSITNSTEPNQNLITSELNTNNNGDDFDIFLDALHKIKSEKININKKMQKCSSFKGINTNKKNILNNNKKIYKNLNLNYYDNDNTININSNFYNKKIKKNFSIDNKNSNDLWINNDNNLNEVNNNSKRIYQLFSDNYIGNKIFNNNRHKRNNINKENDLYINKPHNHNSVQIHNIISPSNIKENLNLYYSNNYYQKTNYILKEKYNTNEENRISPLGHIVDNFVTMLKGKNVQRNRYIKKNSTKSQNYCYNKYNADIMNKKRKLEDMCLTDNRIKSNSTKRIQNKRKNPVNERNNKINKIKEMKAINVEKKNVINDNDNFSFNNNNNITNQTSFDKEKKFNNTHNLLKENNHLNKFNKYNNENTKEFLTNSFNNYIYQKKESIKNQIQKNRIKMKVINKENKENLKNNKRKEKRIMSNILKKIPDNFKKKNILSHFTFTKDNYNKDNNNINNNNKLKIENFNISIQETKLDKEKNTPKYNDISFNNKSAINQLTSSKFEKNIEIQNISNISYNPHPSINITKNFNETVAEKVRKLIMKKAVQNMNKPSLYIKLNLNTDLSLTDSENEKQSTDINIIKKNINFSTNTIFNIYYKNNKISILAFDYENKAFSLHDFTDLNNFEENYKLSLKNNNKGNLFLNMGKYLYIITGENCHILYIFDSDKKIMKKLCKLRYNHSNGNLINYENNLICLSGDYNKSVEMYQIKNNIWNNMSPMLKERSNSGVCILNNKYILNLFGYNFPSKQYLDNIEYYDMTNQINPNWKCLHCNNFVLKIKNFFCFCNNNKIIIIGGKKYNSENEEKKEKYNNNFIKIIFEEKNLDNNKNIKIEELIGKIKDINKNKNYMFFDIGKKYEDKNGNHYQVFDTKYNCHIFKGNNNTHDIFYSNF